MATKKMTAIRIDQDIEREAKEIAKAYRRSFSNLIEYLLYAEIAKFKGVNINEDTVRNKQ